MFTGPARVASDEATGWMVVRRVAGELVPQNDVLRASNVRRIEASTKAVATSVERRNSLAVAACDGDHAERNVVVDSTRGGNTKRREPKRSGSQGRSDTRARVERRRPSYSFPVEQADDAGRARGAVDRTTRSLRQHIGEPLDPRATRRRAIY